MGNTSLICASQNGHLEVVKYLIDKRANIESKDNKNLHIFFLKWKDTINSCI